MPWSVKQTLSSSCVYHPSSTHRLQKALFWPFENFPLLLPSDDDQNSRLTQCLMSSVSIRLSERFALRRISYISINCSRWRYNLLRAQAGIAVGRCAARGLHKGFRPPIRSFYFREWKIRSRRGVEDESTVYSDENLEGGEVDNVEISVDGDVYQRTLRLVECAMFAAVTGLVYYLSNSLAIEVGFFIFVVLLISSGDWSCWAGNQSL